MHITNVTTELKRPEFFAMYIDPSGSLSIRSQPKLVPAKRSYLTSVENANPTIEAGHEFKLCSGYDSNGGNLETIKLLAVKRFNLRDELQNAISHRERVDAAFAKHKEAYSDRDHAGSVYRYQVVPKLLIEHLLREGFAVDPPTPPLVKYYQIDDHYEIENVRA